MSVDLMKEEKRVNNNDDNLDQMTVEARAHFVLIHGINGGHGAGTK